MDIGLAMSTRGLLTRDERDLFLQRVEPGAMRPIELAELAERLGYHSLWFSDTSAWAATSVPRVGRDLFGFRFYGFASGLVTDRSATAAGVG